MTGTIFLACVAALPLAACATSDEAMPLVFGRTQTLGVSVAGSVPDQGAHITLGFSDRNIAIVPTTAPGGTGIRGIVPSADGSFEDALSVLGQFEANADAQSVTTSLGTFFSTGMASRLLAEGFRCKLSGSEACPPQ
jgi:hypothetical protein